VGIYFVRGDTAHLQASLFRAWPRRRLFIAKSFQNPAGPNLSARAGERSRAGGIPTHRRGSGGARIFGDHICNASIG